MTATANFNFAYRMNQTEFMFTKNFNNKVNCHFQKDAASILAPDTARALELVQLAQYQFDLAELYARKFRKQLHEVKHTFSNNDFFKPTFDSIQVQFVKRYTLAQNETQLGHDKTKLKSLHKEVLSELTTFSGYCKDCKPHKKRKPKKD